MSEPNEREAFEAIYPVPDGIWFHADGDYINKDDTPNEYNNMWHIWQATWQHQQKKIYELEETVKWREATIEYTTKQFQSLQAKLNVAVNMLKEIGKNDKHHFSYKYARVQAIEALAEINKIGE